ncbi:MAG: flagellar biosynthetic protein FliQ [Bacteroidota bacterium]|jgi:flagellar biosynthetic protein FliQ
MNTEVGVYWVQEMLSAVVFLAGPLLMGALVVGLLVAVFQAATSIQEMTLTYIPKMIVVALMLFFLFSYMLQYAISFTERIFNFIPMIGQ